MDFLLMQGFLTSELLGFYSTINIKCKFQCHGNNPNINKNIINKYFMTLKILILAG